MTFTDTDLAHLSRCVELASEAVDAGDEPFGSVLVDGSGKVRFEDRNRVRDGDRTRHPEFEIARWAVKHLSPRQRARATVYTSGEHCPMCSAAHAWAGLGRIVYATSSSQLASWLAGWRVPPGPVAPLPIREVAPGVEADGPVAQFADEIRALHRDALFRPKRPRGTPDPAPGFDLQHYLGSWFEVGRLPLPSDEDESDVSVEFTLRRDGTIHADNRAITATGEPVQAVGKMIPLRRRPGAFRVSISPSGLRWVPFSRAEHRVLMIDRAYRVALVGTPDRKNLWLLSREPGLDAETEERFLVAAAQEGYDLRGWVRPRHSGRTVSDEDLAAG